MEENKDDVAFNKRTEEKAEEGIKMLLEEKELKMSWRKEIQENEAIQNYFKSFNPNSINSFIDSYITDKYLWYKYGNMYKSMTEDQESQWIDLAHEHLEIILQKQLFDLQCLWRAEQIQLETVEICYDFTYWEHNIINCPFLKDISEYEISLYQEYLNKGKLNFESSFWGEDWQEYNQIKEDYADEDFGEDLPSWYEYHNIRTGNAKYLLLPDIRGAKEQVYLDLYYAAARNESIASGNITGDYVPSTVPSLSTYDSNTMSFFVKTFENKEIQKQYKYYNKANDDNDDQVYEDLFSEMMDIKESIPIKKNKNFKEALQKAYHQYKCKKIAEHMPLAHKQYLLNKKMGFDVNSKRDFYLDIRSRCKNNILEGRKLNGDAADLDF